MPGVRSVTLAVYATVGSRDESPADAGASHFLEHLLFKGSPTRTARQLALAVDAVGGEMNASTGRESTGYYLRLPASALAEGLDVLTDVVAAPAFRPAEVEAEREVILEEILMCEDDPDDVAHSALGELLYPDHPLGRETLGSRESVVALERDRIAEFHAEQYLPGSLVVAAAGDLDHDQVVAALGPLTDLRTGGGDSARDAPVKDPEPLRATRRPTEQAHVAIGWHGLDLHDDDRYALLVGSHILGGGTASRLWQEVREDRGLAYGISSSPSFFGDSGVFTIGVGTAPTRLGELMGVVDDVLEGLLADGVTDEEHEVALGYLTGSTLLGLEDSGSRMARLAHNEMVRRRVVTVDEHLAAIRAVTPADVRRVMRRVLDAPRSVSAVGPVDDTDPVLVAAAGWRR
jgi:predicted Zn-dependent peptidase